MTLDPNGQSNTGGAPAAAPALTAEDIQAMVDAKVEAATEVRVRGLQSTYERQLAGLRNERDEALRDPQSYDASHSSRLEAELADARRESDALRVARQYPEIFPVYEAVLAAKSPVEQLDILQAFVRAQTAPPAQAAQAQAVGNPAAPAGTVAPPPVDLNRNVRNPGGVPSTFNPEGMDATLADQIIGAIGDRWPQS